VLRAKGIAVLQVYWEAVLLSRLQNHANIIRCYGLVANPQHNNSSTMGGSITNKVPSDLHGSLVMERLEMDLGKLLRDDKGQLSLVDTLPIAQVGNEGKVSLQVACKWRASGVLSIRKPPRRSSCMLLSACHCFYCQLP
jgi:hypothetical protein